MSKKNPKVNVTIRVIKPDWTQEVLLPKTKVPLKNLWENLRPGQPFTWSTATVFADVPHSGHVHRREYTSANQLMTIWVVQDSA